MINGIHFELCGLTSLVDADAAMRRARTHLGFSSLPKIAPLCQLRQFKAMASRLPPRKGRGGGGALDRGIDRNLGAGFDDVQLHFPNETPFFMAALWLDVTPPDCCSRCARASRQGLRFGLCAVGRYHTARYRSSRGPWWHWADWRLEGFRVAPHEVQKVNWVLAWRLESGKRRRRGGRDRRAHCRRQ